MLAGRPECRGPDTRTRTAGGPGRRPPRRRAAVRAVRRRAAARVDRACLANRPPVILADEPTAPLDSERALAVVRILNQMAVQYHTAVIVVTARRRSSRPSSGSITSATAGPKKRRGRLEPLTRSSPVSAAVNQEQECEHIQGGLAGEVTGRGRCALRVADGPVRRSPTVRWRSGAPGRRGHSALRALVQLRRRVRLRGLRSGGLWQRRRWSVPLAVFIAAATGLVFAAFGVHAWSGGAYETRTVGAMALRTLLWAGIAATAHRVLRQRI